LKSPSFISHPSSAFRDVVSGGRRGFVAAALRGVLAIAELPYTWAVRARNRGYESGRYAVHRAPDGVPVISVGNLSLGGTGKTPMVEWIVGRILAQGKRPGIISRGYGGRGGPNDEARELAWKLPSVPHEQNPDRVAAARRAVRERGCQVLVLDDAFQHRRIARDLDIVLLDALEPFGFEHVFPRGTLREPIDGLARADVVALSRADLLTADERAAIRSRAAQLAPKALWVEAIHAPLELVSAGNLPSTTRCTQQEGRGRAPCTHGRGEGISSQLLETLRGRRVLAFCGLGNPAGFRHTLETCGYDVVAFHEFPDHHAYSPADLEVLATAAGNCEAEALVCTQKDLVKIGLDRLGDRSLWAIRVGIEFLAGREEFERKLPIFP
jgi:tetraacyldisaccharide 4'-kinase